MLNRILKINVVLFFLAAGHLVSGQGILNPQNEDRNGTEPTDSIEIRPFRTSRISSALNESYAQINEAGSNRIPISQLSAFKARIDTLSGSIAAFMGDSALRSLERMSLRELDNTDNRADFYLGELTRVQDRLSRSSRETTRYAEQLQETEKRWMLTLETTPAEEMPESRQERIREITQQADSMQNVLARDLEVVLTFQDRLAGLAADLEGLQSGISDQKLLLGERMLTRDMPGFFSDLSTLGDTTLVANHLDQMRRTIRTDTEVLRAEYTVPLLFFTLLIVIMLVIAIWYKKHFARLISIEKFEFSEIHLTTIYSPVITVIFIAALLIRLLFPDLPRTYASLNLVILMVPMVAIVIRLYGSLARGWMLPLIIVFVLTFIYELIYYPDIYLRIILLFFSITAFVIFAWMILKKPLENRFSNKLLYGIFRLILAGFTLLLFISIIGNLVGAFRMAEFFTLVTIQVVVLAIGIQVTIKVADTIIFLLLAGNTVQKLNVFREEFKIIYRKSVGLINFFLWVFFAVTALNIFQLKEPFFTWGRNVLTSGWKIGEVSITPGSILIFVFVIWLSIFITRIIRHILEKDVFARVETARGMPSTIILLVRIGLITGGFFLAARAAGMQLTNLSIVLGAFSVGIGFGLQNIFNNMVSGLILAFERPIKVGDTVQVGELLGVVLSIGLRSSRVRSFDGAEVIVPNGNLISNQMINWTLSDSFRRMDIRIGVAYGTDPQQVLDLIQDVAMEHKQVNKYPAPTSYFIGFGDSSLDFRLLAWADIEVRLNVESDLHVAINNRLREAGIEIPFPQRDLHIRSDSREKPDTPDL